MAVKHKWELGDIFSSKTGGMKGWFIIETSPLGTFDFHCRLIKFDSQGVEDNNMCDHHSNPRLLNKKNAVYIDPKVEPEMYL